MPKVEHNICPKQHGAAGPSEAALLSLTRTMSGVFIERRNKRRWEEDLARRCSRDSGVEMGISDLPQGRRPSCSISYTTATEKMLLDVYSTCFKAAGLQTSKLQLLLWSIVTGYMISLAS